MSALRPLFLPAAHALVALIALAGSVASAGEIDAELDPRMRARLMKEKSKMNAEETNPALKSREVGSRGSPDATCGSQNIGNVDTGGRPGNTPREIFVFAPNAINIVGPRACGN